MLFPSVAVHDEAFFLSRVCSARDIVREIHVRERQRLIEEHQSHVALLEAEIARLEAAAQRARRGCASRHDAIAQQAIPQAMIPQPAISQGDERPPRASRERVRAARAAARPTAAARHAPPASGAPRSVSLRRPRDFHPPPAPFPFWSVVGATGRLPVAAPQLPPTIPFFACLLISYLSPGARAG